MKNYAIVGGLLLIERLDNLIENALVVTGNGFVGRRLLSVSSRLGDLETRLIDSVEVDDETKQNLRNKTFKDLVHMSENLGASNDDY